MGVFPIIHIDNILEMKKPHPCGSRLFKVLRIGSDIKIVCTGCGHTLTLERIKLEKMIKKVISEGENND
jgi:hypothetical protein